MDTYDARLATFTNWPADSPVKKEDLARAGQVYMGYGDETRCYVCNRRLSGWEKGDDPYSEHKKGYPDCELSKQPPGHITKPASVKKTGVDLAGTSVTERFEELTIQSEGPSRELHEDYSTYRGRLESFQQGWQHEDNLLSQNLALAGFHYTGGDDRVKCSGCQLVMDTWQPMEVPYYEHRAARPQCPFIQSTENEIKAFPDKLPVRQLSPSVEQDPSYTTRGYRFPDASGEKRLSLPMRSDTPTCIKCKQNPKQILFEPCSHMVLCEICSMEYSNCPVCGCPIIKKSRMGGSGNTSISTT